MQRLMLMLRLALPQGTQPRHSSSCSISSCCCSSCTSNSIEMDYGVYQMPYSQLNMPPILLLHNLNLSRAVWQGTARQMSRRGTRRVFAVDARNHGRSPHAKEHTPAAMAGDVEAFIEQHQLGPIVALGHSVGGRALMTLALTRPELVERIIVVDITPGPLPTEVIEVSKLFRLMVELTPCIPKDFSLTEARRFLLPALGELFSRDTELLAVLQNLRKCDDGSFAWNINAQAILDGWNETMVDYEYSLIGLDPFPGEALLIAASKESFVTSQSVESMRKFFPNLQVKYLDAEHRVYLDRPNEFVNLVVDFTESCTGSKD